MRREKRVKQSNDDDDDNAMVLLEYRKKITNYDYLQINQMMCFKSTKISN